MNICIYSSCSTTQCNGIWLVWAMHEWKLTNEVLWGNIWLVHCDATAHLLSVQGWMYGHSVGESFHRSLSCVLHMLLPTCSVCVKGTKQISVWKKTKQKHMDIFEVYCGKSVIYNIMQYVFIAIYFLFVSCQPNT